MPPCVDELPLQYAMPAEWQEHDATWLAWPHNHEDWPGKFSPIPHVYAEIVRILARGERVHLLTQPSKNQRTQKQIAELLADSDVNLAHVTLHEVPTDRIWLRDSGPIFLKRKTNNRKSKIEEPVALVDFKFNAWAKYDNSARDDQVPAYVARHLGATRYIAYGENNARERQRFVLEGGSIDVNGMGCLLTTEECLLSTIQQRNPGFSRARIENTLHEYLGIEQVLWLSRGIAGDDTHGHIDDAARFTSPGTIAACVEPDRSDPNHLPLHANLRRLARMRDARGKPFTIAELPMPEPVFFRNQRLPASYANFYIANAGILVPVFNDPRDARALKVLEACFPGRTLFPIYCRDLVWGLGTLHCLTQQQPA